MGHAPVELPVTTLVSLVEKGNLGEPHAILAGGERYVSRPGTANRMSQLATGSSTRSLVQRARVEY